MTHEDWSDMEPGEMPDRQEAAPAAVRQRRPRKAGVRRISVSAPTGWDAYWAGHGGGPGEAGEMARIVAYFLEHTGEADEEVRVRRELQAQIANLQRRLDTANERVRELTESAETDRPFWVRPTTLCGATRSDAVRWWDWLWRNAYDFREQHKPWIRRVGLPTEVVNGLKAGEQLGEDRHKSLTEAWVPVEMLPAGWWEDLSYCEQLAAVIGRWHTILQGGYSDPSHATEFYVYVRNFWPSMVETMTSNPSVAAFKLPEPAWQAAGYRMKWEVEEARKYEAMYHVTAARSRPEWKDYAERKWAEHVKRLETKGHSALLYDAYQRRVTERLDHEFGPDRAAAVA